VVLKVEPDSISQSIEGVTASNYRKKRQARWDTIALKTGDKKSWSMYYHHRLLQIYKFLIVPGQRVLEIGCGTGDLIGELEPEMGVGIDFSDKMVKHAVKKYPKLNFIQCDVHEICLREKFDVIILSDLVNDLWDVQSVFSQIRRLSTPETRVVLNIYSKLWEMPLFLTQSLGMTKKLLPQNWLTIEDITGLLKLTGFETIRHWSEVLWPFDTPILGNFINRVIVKLWPFHFFALSNFMIARLRPSIQQKPREPVVSVIIPARNEEGNIPDIFARVPEMGSGTELVFVEGLSKDNTYLAIEKAMAEYPKKKSKLFCQPGVGKGDAVRLGFAKATGDVLMILDADLTVPPEQLPRFYDALYSGEGEFINGVRLVYPMEKQAMRYLNLMGNKFFSLAFSWLLGQSIKDTLCGTKVLWKTDYKRIADNRKYFGNFDPFGDFDLLFGSAKLNLKIVEVPIRYAERRYGSTNIQRWKHGWLLLRMVLFASRRIKFL
jgi:ubiquinone/menaquinone biosynthesis C-methylase UbiE